MVTREKVVPQKLSGEAFRALQSVVGKEWVTEDRAIIETYVVHTIDPAASLRVLMRDPSVRPAAVVLPASTEEVQEVVKVANRYGFPVQPWANAQMMSSPVIPGTVLISMRRMDECWIDEENMTITIQPNVTYGVIHHEASKRGLWLGGSGWHGAIAKPCSQYTLAGIWQSDLKYCGLARNGLGMKVVLADGSLLRLGSAAIAGTGDVPWTERFPGPNLIGMMKNSFGARGIITELTLKLHPWVGGHPFPDDIGHPCIEHFFEEGEQKKFDRPPTHPRHKIFWLEYPDMQSFVSGLAELATSGIGVCLDSTGDYNSMMCSYSIAEANRRSQERYFGTMGYMVLAGVSSEKQLAYEEKVLKHIVDKTGGKVCGPEYRPDKAEAQAPWNVEFCLNTETGMRTVRSNYMAAMFGCYSTFDNLPEGAKVWEEIEKELGSIGVDRGEHFGRMQQYCPYGYIADRGHQVIIECDQFPERTSPDEIIFYLQSAVYAWFRYATLGFRDSWPLEIVDPWMCSLPEHGPDTYLMYRDFRRITDPKGVFGPGKQAFMEEEFKGAWTAPPEEQPVLQIFLGMREKAGLPKLELTEEADRWKPVE